MPNQTSIAIHREISARADEHKLFDAVPSKYEIAQIREHILQTGTPETSEILYQGAINKTEFFEPFASFQIAAIKRQAPFDSERAYCPMCGRANQYTHGVLVFLPGLFAVAAIGRECADQDQLKAGLERRRQEDKTLEAEDWLIENLPKVPSHQQALQTLKPAVLEADRILPKIRTRGKDALGQIRHALKSSDRLQIFVTNENNQVIRSEDFGVPSGATVFRGNYRPLVEYNKIEQTLRRYEGFPNSEAALDAVALWTMKEILAAYDELKNQTKEFAKLKGKMEDIWLFFEPQNILKLNEWGDHLMQPKRFRIIFSRTGVKYPFYIKSNIDDVDIRIDPLLWQTDVSWPT